MRLRRHMREREEERKKFMLLCKDGHTLAFAIKVRNRPKVAVRFKVVVVNPSQIKKVFHQRPVLTMQASEVEDLNLLCHG